jgi:hypothetical protein
MENRNGVEIPENEDSTSTDSEDIFYDTETQTNATNGKGSEIAYINVRSLVVINKCQILPENPLIKFIHFKVNIMP